MDAQKQIPIQPVDKPVICSPYEEPDYHWDYDKRTGVATKTKGRRQAGYWYLTQQFGTKGKGLFEEVEAEAMEAEERTLLASLGVADPYRPHDPAHGNA